MNEKSKTNREKSKKNKDRLRKTSVNMGKSGVSRKLRKEEKTVKENGKRWILS